MYCDYYVYAYLREDGSPYYIGKGRKLRAIQTHGSFKSPRDRSRIVYLERNLTATGSLALERRMIRWYGRKDLGTGILHNKTDGGDGTAFNGEKNYFYGKKGEDAYWYGKKRPWTEEQRRKQSEIQKHTTKYKRTPEHNAMMSERVKAAKAAKGKIMWWTDGVNSKQTYECPGPSWRRGRTLNGNAR